MDDNDNGSSGNGEHPGQAQVALQKIYLRDASVEVPDGPRVFTRDYHPEVNVDLNSRAEELGGDSYQVLLSATVSAKQGDDTAYIVEVQQAGVFQVSGFDDDGQRAHVLGAYCPGVLFPFVREAVADMIQRAGFPHFLLQPVNFDALFQEQQNRAAQPEDPTAH